MSDRIFDALFSLTLSAFCWAMTALLTWAAFHSDPTAGGGAIVMGFGALVLTAISLAESFAANDKEIVANRPGRMTGDAPTGDDNV